MGYNGDAVVGEAWQDRGHLYCMWMRISSAEDGRPVDGAQRTWLRPAPRGHLGEWA
jgi:hypothetical protein